MYTWEFIENYCCLFATELFFAQDAAPSTPYADRGAEAFREVVSVGWVVTASAPAASGVAELGAGWAMIGYSGGAAPAPPPGDPSGLLKSS